MAHLDQLGERQVIARIRARLEASAPIRTDLVVGIGDDAAVVRPRRNRQTVLTTDGQVEGVHFDRRFSAPLDVGHRALAVNLSDLAAMGATPRWALLSLALPDAFPVEDIDGMVDGLARLAADHGMAVIGGNLTRSPGPLMIDVTAVGDVHPRGLLTRGGGRAGDEVFVSGSIGGAAAGLEMLRAGAHGPPERVPTHGLVAQGCIDRYLRPLPRVKLGEVAGRARAARAAMDLSDGLADAATQVAEASGCGIELDAASLPIDDNARAWWQAGGTDPITEAIRGGDDYELLLVVPPKWIGRLRHARSRGGDVTLTRIGRLTKDRSVHLLWRTGRAEVLPEGYDHWRAREAQPRREPVG